MIDEAASIAALEERIAAVDPTRDRHEHAALAYRVGLAHAELPAGDRRQNLETALRWYERALAGFDVRFDPVSHARVLNALGAAVRGLGRTERAADLFARAGELLRHRGRDDERAACLNNLGLARSEMGQVDEARTVLDEAVHLFDTSHAEGRRGAAATLVNLGMAVGSVGTVRAQREAMEAYERAVAALGDDDAPYHRALARHAGGVAAMSVAALEPASARDSLDVAVRSFEDSLVYFSRSGFPFQHSLAKHNLGRALLARGGEKDLLRALASVEDAAGVLDPRIHQVEWGQAMVTLGLIEEALAHGSPGRSRRDHFVALFELCETEERSALLRDRLARLLAMPPDARHSMLREAAAASLRSHDQGKAYVTVELTVLATLPNEHLEAALEARLDAHAHLSPDRREDADRALDQAVGDALNGPQRVFVRDFLSARGFERP